MNQNKSGFFASIPVVTKNLLIINVIVWLFQFVALQKFGFDLSTYLGLHYWEAENFQIFQLITYMFLHSPFDFTHVFFNMFAVFMFGRTLETVWGSKRFLTYYMITGIGAGIVQLIITFFRIKYLEAGMSSEVIDIASMANLHLLINTPTIGASGAVFGILLAFGMLFPNAELIMIPIPIPIKAKYFVIGYGLLELFLGISNRAGDNVAHFAHLGGMIFGIILILYWKNKNKIHGKFY